MTSELPIDQHLGSVLAALREAHAAVLQAPTGAGKTTRVPLALGDDNDSGIVILLQPRRLAARTAANRMAFQTGTKLGSMVGYHVRFDRNYDKNTKIIVMTDGLYLQRLIQDPFLEGISTVIFDEFHERSINSDLALALTRQVQQEVRNELNILVMSATLDCAPISTYLGNCPVIVTEGRSFPVQIDYLPYPSKERIAERCATGIITALERSKGDILAFLPGVGEIKATHNLLTQRLNHSQLVIAPLYGALKLEDQRQAIAPSPHQKIVLSTNIAETSLTIPDVRTVVDTGIARVNRLDNTTGFNRLDLEPISQASATQRAGRAGRTAPGHCFRLWTKREDQARPHELEPEINRIDLSSAVLALINWGEPDVALFNWYQPPPAERLNSAIQLLEDLGAIQGRNLTPTGQQLATLPAPPRIGRLLLACADGGFADKGSLLAALLSERDPFDNEARFNSAQHCDLQRRANAFESNHPSLYRGHAHQIRQVVRQFSRMTKSSLRRTMTDELLGRALISAFPDRVARRREPGSPRALLVGGAGVRLSPRSAVTEHEFFICLRMVAGKTGPRSEATVHWASPIEKEWLATETRTTTYFDPESERVKAVSERHFKGLVLDEKTAPLPLNGDVERLLAHHALRNFDRIFCPNKETEQLIHRIHWLANFDPRQNLLPVGPEYFQEHMATACEGKRGFNQLKTHNWKELILESLTWVQRQALNKLAPERLQVPTGNQIKLEYSAEGPPVLKVRIQELFGLTTTPTIGGGRAPVLLHLLAPNMRPQQITTDLAGFWSNSYIDVRKELRQRYPKHSWPEDPATAAPEKRPRRKSK